MAITHEEIEQIKAAIAPLIERAVAAARQETGQLRNYEVADSALDDSQLSKCEDAATPPRPAPGETLESLYDLGEHGTPVSVEQAAKMLNLSEDEVRDGWDSLYESRRAHERLQDEILRMEAEERRRAEWLRIKAEQAEAAE